LSRGRPPDIVDGPDEVDGPEERGVEDPFRNQIRPAAPTSRDEHAAQSEAGFLLAVAAPPDDGVASWQRMRERAAAALRDRHERLRVVSDASLVGTWSMDPETGEVFADVLVPTLFGLGPEPMHRFDEYAQRVADEDRPRLLDAVARALAGEGQGYVHVEPRVAGVVGAAPRWVEVRAKVDFDERGQATRLFGTMTDATARHEAEAELRLADQRKDEFLATLAHELRNPLAAISSALALLDRASDPARAAHYRETARRQMNNVVRLVDDLLDVARITRGEVTLRREAVDFASVVQCALTATRESLEARRHDLAVTVRPGGYRMDADGTRLEQVVVNLLRNAAKYTDPGGKISVDLGHDDTGDAPVALLRVRDTGRGIPRAMLERVFDLFVQVSPSIDRETGGLGIGLTLVKSLVAMHGGTVTASSDGRGKGSEFAVRLPLRAENGPRAADGAGAAAKASDGLFRRRRILIVEDSEGVRETLKDLLVELGHEVFVAIDGLQGLMQFKAVRPDVALVDVGLPRIDGFEFARRVRAHRAADRSLLIALTGYGDRVTKARARLAGFDLHLTKPVDLEALPEILRGAGWPAPDYEV
jgi:signal transduction histidine kinase